MAALPRGAATRVVTTDAMTVAALRLGAATRVVTTVAALPRGAATRVVTTVAALRRVVGTRAVTTVAALRRVVGTRVVTTVAGDPSRGGYQGRDDRRDDRGGSPSRGGYQGRDDRGGRDDRRDERGGDRPWRPPPRRRGTWSPRGRAVVTDPTRASSSAADGPGTTAGDLADGSRRLSGQVRIVGLGPARRHRRPGAARARRRRDARRRLARRPQPRRRLRRRPRRRTAGDAPALIVVAVPPDVTAEVVRRELAALRMRSSPMSASVKVAPLAELREPAASTCRRYVGSHPLAGRERGGADLGPRRPVRRPPLGGRRPRRDHLPPRRRRRGPHPRPRRDADRDDARGARRGGRPRLATCRRSSRA